MESFVQLSCLLPELWSLKCHNWLIFLYLLLMATKKPVTVWAKYLSASKRTHLTLLESTMDYWVLSYHLQDDNLSEYKILVFFTDSAVFLIFLLSVSHEW